MRVLAAEPAIRIVEGEQGGPVAFEAVGLSADRIAPLKTLPADDERWGALLSVRVFDPSEKSESPPMLGKHSLEGGAVRFTPRYPLRPGLRYRVTLVPEESGSRPIKRDVTVPEEAQGKAAEITHVFPSAAVLPENQLKFYIHFSAPMARGEAYEHLQLLKADGQPVDLPFLEIGEELWDGSGRRFTLLIDPGRIKRGVKPLEDLGPALEAGREYTLTIDAAWKDADGRPLAKGLRKRFKVSPPIRTAIDPAEWKVAAPQAGTTDPFTVRFPRPFDRGLLERTLTVHDPGGERVRGGIAVSDEERLWQFQPATAWKSGKYHLTVDTALEDLAGNQIGRAFEVDRTEQITKTVQPKTVQIPFVIVVGR